MKTIKYILSVTIITFLINSCTFLLPHCEGYMFEYEQGYYYPHKDTFYVGDTVWINMSFPKTFESDCGTMVFEKDSILTQLSFYIELDAKKDTVYCVSQGEVVSVIGKHNGDCTFYFVPDSNNRYVYECYYILKDTGKINFVDFSSATLIEIKDNVSTIKNCKKTYEHIGYYFTSFKETGEGGFTLLVKP